MCQSSKFLLRSLCMQRKMFSVLRHANTPPQSYKQTGPVYCVRFASLIYPGKIFVLAEVKTAKRAGCSVWHHPDRWGCNTGCQYEPYRANPGNVASYIQREDTPTTAGGMEEHQGADRLPRLERNHIPFFHSGIKPASFENFPSSWWWRVCFYLSKIRWGLIWNAVNG